MSSYNIVRIRNRLEDFQRCKRNFQNNYYPDFKESYLFKSNDAIVINVRNRLDEFYSKINRAYNAIDTYWTQSLNDIENIDKAIAGKVSTGCINDSTVALLINSLPSLPEYSNNVRTLFGSGYASVRGDAHSAKEWVVWASENPEEARNQVVSTCAVVTTSVISGAGKVFEKLSDGLLLIGGLIAQGVLYVAYYNDEESREFVMKSAQETTMDMIEKDVVGDSYKKFYEQTEAGKWINENSAIKYDSETALKIQSISEKVTLKVLEVAASVIPGGGPVLSGAIGGLYAMGDTAEENFQKEDRDFWKTSASATVDGFLGFIDGYTVGKMTKSVVSTVNTIRSFGAKNVAKEVLNTGKNVLNEKVGVNTFKKISSRAGKTVLSTLKESDFYTDFFGTSADTFKSAVETGQWTMEDTMAVFSNLTTSFSVNYLQNLVFGDSFDSTPKKAGVDVNTSSMKNNIDDVNIKNVEIPSGATKTKADANIDSLRKEYDELSSVTKEDWFIKAKEARDNGWAWNLNEVNEADNIVKRMQELESDLDIKNTGVPESKIYDYSQAKKEADELARKISEEPIPILEKYKVDTNSPEYKKAMQEIYSKPSPSGKQVLSQINNPFKKSEPLTLDDLKYQKSSSLDYASDYLESNISKFVYKDTSYFGGLNDQIKTNGLYHFTTHADEILDSGYIKSSGVISSYGTPKTYFFNGVPNAGQIATNIDDLPLRATAVKVNPTDEILNSKKLKIRSLDDGAISFNGKFDLTDANASKQYLCLFKENDELVYKVVSKEIYDAYPNTIEGKQIADFLSNKKNINAIKSDYLSELSNSRKKISKVSKVLETDTQINSNVIRSQKNYYLNDLNGSARRNFLEGLDSSIKENGMSSFDNCAKRIGVTREELLVGLDKKTKEIVDKSDFGIRITDENLYKVLKSGEFKNQFETGTSKGVLDTNKRAISEKTLFGVPDNASLSDRPVYGMLFPKLEEANPSSLNYYKNIYNGRSYGDTVVILKKNNVINNTTITFGDSLTYMPQPTEAINPQFNGGFSGIYSHINSMDDLSKATINDLSDGINAYPEIQLHGASSHGIENIEKVIFMGPPDKKVLKILKKSKIPFEIM